MTRFTEFLRTEKKTILLVIGFALVLLVFCGPLFPPASWKAIHLGDSYSNVEEKFPQLGNMYLHKGLDVLVEERFGGRWVTFYLYADNNRLRSKELVYRLGTAKHYTTIWFGKEGGSIRPALDLNPSVTNSASSVNFVIPLNPSKPSLPFSPPLQPFAVLRAKPSPSPIPFNFQKFR